MLASTMTRLIAVSVLGSTASGGGSAASSLAAVRLGDLHVTRGDIAEIAPGRLLVDGPKMRATLAFMTDAEAALRFTYLGPTRSTAPLASGEIRRQLGLKLRAANTCNVVFVMWRLEPKNEVVVSVKSNPGSTLHAQCGNRGYTNMKARWKAPAPPVRPGVPHVLSARLSGEG